jgi:hypothetical protein
LELFLTEDRMKGTCLLSAMLVVASSLAAQTPRRVALGPAAATLNAEFSQIANMRELSDGRVLVTDFREQSITVADFKSGTTKTVGRRGDGPGEYVLVGPLHAFGGDTTLMVMELAKRWTVITPDLKFSTIPPDAPIVELLGNGRVQGTDATGRLISHGWPRRGPGIERDTSPLLLVSWRSNRVDTIGRTDGGPAPQPRTGGRDEIRPFEYYDRTVMGRDGWIAVVRRNPYRVDWRTPDGRWRIGTPVADPPVRFTSEEKDAYLERRVAARAAASTKVIIAPGVGTTKAGAPSRPEPTIIFPDVIPPFAGLSAVLMSPNGDLLVQRTPTAAMPAPLFDVFDRQGNRTFQLTMASNQRPIAFGASSLYVVSTDDDGIQRLARHPWPTRR